MTLADKADVEAARGLVDTAKNDHGAVDEDITNLATLEAAEGFMADLEEADAAVAAAEASEDQTDVDYARTLVSALPDGVAKSALSDRLDAVQASIDAAAKAAAIAAAIAAIDGLPELSAMTLADKADVEAARGLVDTAKNDHGAVDEDITNLATLEVAEAFMTDLEAADAAVAVAEASRLQSDFDAAQTLVNDLPVGAARDELQARLNAIDILPSGTWTAELLDQTVSLFNLSVRQLDQATHYELYILGNNAGRKAIGENIGTLTMFLNDPVGSELKVLFFDGADAVSPIAGAVCEPTGELTIEYAEPYSGTWSVTEVLAGLSADFTLTLQNINFATHYELYVDGVKIDRVSVDSYIRHLPIVFQDPSKFELRFYGNETASTPIVRATCSGGVGTTEGILLFIR
jgi:hypothetical protein